MGRDSWVRPGLSEAGVFEGDPEQLPGFEVLHAAVKKHAPSKRAPQQSWSVESVFVHNLLEPSKLKGVRCVPKALGNYTPTQSRTSR